MEGQEDPESSLPARRDTAEGYTARTGPRSSFSHAHAAALQTPQLTAMLANVQNPQERLELLEDLRVVESLTDMLATTTDPRAIQTLMGLLEKHRDKVAARSERAAVARFERRITAYKMGIAPALVALGSGFIFHGDAIVGEFVLGGGMYLVAERYVRDFFGRFLPGGKQQDNSDTQGSESDGARTEAP